MVAKQLQRNINLSVLDKLSEESGDDYTNILNKLSVELGCDDDKTAINKLLELIQKTKGLSSGTYIQQIGFALKLSQQTGHISGIVQSYIYLGSEHWKRSNYEVSLEYFQLALKENESLNDNINEAEICQGLGNNCLRMGFLDGALKYYTRSLSIYKKKENKDACGSLYNNIGVVYKEKGEYEKAISFYLDSLKIKEASGDLKAVANTYMNIGIIYNLQENHTQALSYFEKILKIPSEELGDVIFSNVHNNIGQTYVGLGEYEKALNHLQFALSIKSKIGDKRGIALSYQEIGRIMFLEHNYKSAIDNYSKAINISREIGAPSDEADLLHLLGEVSYKMNDYEKAEQHLSQSYDIRKRLDLKPALARTCKLLADLYYDTNKFMKSCYYMRVLMKTQKELSNEEKDRILTEMQIRFEVQQRDSTIKALNIKQEMLLKSNQELELFAGKAAHDMKEPLRMMSSFSSLLVHKYNEKLDDEGREFLTHINDGAKRMQGLLSDMLIFAKSGAHPQDAIAVDLNDIIHIVQANLRLKIKETEAKIIYEPLPTVKATNTTMIQLFQNVIANALKFRESDTTPLIEIKAQKHDENFHQISISDNGIGIREGQEEKVFIIFQRLNAKHEYEGSGIGLSTCKKIVECFGGNIWLSSEEGKGTTFFFLLPVIHENYKDE